jgi:host factor-I protein
MNRKLIRPELRDAKERRLPAVTTTKYLQRRHAATPDQTNAESNYYLKQMANHTRMVIVLKDGEELRGTIEWYDRSALKLHRAGAPNLLLMKDSVKYMYKEEEEGGRYQEDEQAGE